MNHRLAVIRVPLDPSSDIGNRTIYELNVPDSTEPDFYRQTTSLNAFFFGLRRRNRNVDFLYIAEHWDDFEMRKEYQNIPRISVAGIWEFYKLIGYDYKTRKWI